MLLQNNQIMFAILQIYLVVILLHKYNYHNNKNSNNNNLWFQVRFFKQNATMIAMKALKDKMMPQVLLCIDTNIVVFLCVKLLFWLLKIHWIYLNLSFFEIRLKFFLNQYFFVNFVFFTVTVKINCSMSIENLLKTTNWHWSQFVDFSRWIECMCVFLAVWILEANLKLKDIFIFWFFLRILKPKTQPTSKFGIQETT